MMTPDLSVVVPLYNEQACVEPLLVALEAAWRSQGDDLKLDWEVLLVNDGSLDATLDSAVAASDACCLPVRVISLQRNFGQTAAMQAGLEAARGELIATMDGDLQNDPADLPTMVRDLRDRDLDLLVGRRKNRKDGFILRKAPSWIANRLIARATGVRIHDYGCSLKLYRRHVIGSVQLMGEMHRFIPAWVATVTHPSRIGEIDVRHHPRVHGQSKYGISRTFRVILDLLAVLFFMKYRRRPGHFFGMIGLGLGALGGVMLSIVFVAKFGFQQDIGDRPMLLLGALLMLAAVQMICFGVMTEMLSRIHHQSQPNPTYLVGRTHANRPVSQPQSTDSFPRVAS